jgi:hypothetical protein
MDTYTYHITEISWWRYYKDVVMPLEKWREIRLKELGI